MTKLEQAREIEQEIKMLEKITKEKMLELKKVIFSEKQIADIEAMGYLIVVYTHDEDLGYGVLRPETDPFCNEGLEKTGTKIEKVGDISDEEFETLLKIIENKGKNDERA
jgi:hypothetical protein